METTPHDLSRLVKHPLGKMFGKTSEKITPDSIAVILEDAITFEEKYFVFLNDLADKWDEIGNEEKNKILSSLRINCGNFKFLKFSEFSKLNKDSVLLLTKQEEDFTANFITIANGIFSDKNLKSEEVGVKASIIYIVEKWPAFYAVLKKVSAQINPGHEHRTVKPRATNGDDGSTIHISENHTNHDQPTA